MYMQRILEQGGHVIIERLQGFYWDCCILNVIIEDHIEREIGKLEGDCNH